MPPKADARRVTLTVGRATRFSARDRHAKRLRSRDIGWIIPVLQQMDQRALLVVTDAAALVADAGDEGFLWYWIRGARLREIVRHRGDRTFLRRVEQLLAERSAVFLFQRFDVGTH